MNMHYNYNKYKINGGTSMKVNNSINTADFFTRDLGAGDIGEIRIDLKEPVDEEYYEKLGEKLDSLTRKFFDQRKVLIDYDTIYVYSPEMLECPEEKIFELFLKEIKEKFPKMLQTTIDECLKEEEEKKGSLDKKAKEIFDKAKNKIFKD